MNPGEKMDCPKCKGAAINITPLKNHDRSIAVFACQNRKCGFAFKADGGEFVEDTERLRDIFRGATLSQRALAETLGGETMNPATKALLTARLLEYGTQMWFDGLKQGLVLGAAKAENG
jgi:hypothetical protein